MLLFNTNNSQNIQGDILTAHCLLKIYILVFQAQNSKNNSHSAPYILTLPRGISPSPLFDLGVYTMVLRLKYQPPVCSTKQYEHFPFQTLVFSSSKYLTRWSYASECGNVCQSLGQESQAQPKGFNLTIFEPSFYPKQTRFSLFSPTI